MLLLFRYMELSFEFIIGEDGSVILAQKRMYTVFLRCLMYLAELENTRKGMLVTRWLRTLLFWRGLIRNIKYPVYKECIIYILHLN